MNAKIECEMLMTEMLPLGEKMLLQFSEFYPYGGYIKPDGEIVPCSRERGGNRPSEIEGLDCNPQKLVWEFGEV